MPTGAPLPILSEYIFSPFPYLKTYAGSASPYSASPCPRFRASATGKPVSFSRNSSWLIMRLTAKRFAGQSMGEVMRQRLFSSFSTRGRSIVLPSISRSVMGAISRRSEAPAGFSRSSPQMAAKSAMLAISKKIVNLNLILVPSG